MKLLEAAKASLTGRAAEETIWVVENTDTLIANQRNISVHMPLMSFTDEDGMHQMLPLTLSGTGGPSIWSVAICWANMSSKSDSKDVHFHFLHSPHFTGTPRTGSMGGAS